MNEPQKTTTQSGSILRDIAVCVAGFLAVFAFIAAGCGGTNESNPQLSKAQVIAEAMYYPDSSGSPVVRLTFTGFPSNPTYSPLQYVIYRNNTGSGSPVQVSPGIQNVQYDNGNLRTFTYYSAPNQASVGTHVCPSTTSASGSDGGISLGVPYVYSAQEVYGQSPGFQSGTCFFETTPVTSVGVATALGTTTLVSPISGATLAANSTPIFKFKSLVEAQPIAVQYVVQISSSPQFLGSATTTSPILASSSASQQEIGFQLPSTLTRYLPTDTRNTSPAVQYWWRVGGRNIADNPGPAPDPTTGLRFIFSPAQSFSVSGGTPAPKPSAAPHRKL